jgi:hypothetical protein
VALGGGLGNVNIGDPVALPACEARLKVLIVEVRLGPAQPRWVDALERIDIDDRVHVSVKLAGDYGYGPAARANMEGRGLGAKDVPGHQGSVADIDRKSRTRV